MLLKVKQTEVLCLEQVPKKLTSSLIENDKNYCAFVTYQDYLFVRNYTRISKYDVDIKILSPIKILSKFKNVKFKTFYSDSFDRGILEKELDSYVLMSLYFDEGSSGGVDARIVRVK